MKNTKKKPAKVAAADAKLAAEWRTTTRTIARWRREKAPLDDPAALRTWLTNRKNLPPGTADLLAEHSIRERQLLSAETLRAIDESPEEVGAVSALKVLSRETAYWARQSEHAKKRGDLTAQKFCGAQLREFSRELLRYETAIEESRRDSGALVRREQMVEILSDVGEALKGALRHQIVHITPELVGLGIDEIATMLRGVAEDCGRVIVDSVASLSAIPEWAAGALQQGHDFLGKPCPPERLEALRTGLSMLLELTEAARKAETETTRRAISERWEDEWKQFRREIAEKRREALRETIRNEKDNK